MQDFSQRSRLLRKNHSTNYPTRILLIDTETRTDIREPYQTHSFRLGWTLFIRVRAERGARQLEWKYWTEASELLDYIESLMTTRSTTWIVGHNLYFDLQALGFYDRVGYGEYEEDFYYDKGLVFLHFLSLGSAHLKLVSSTNWFDFSLRELGELVGQPKYKVDFETADADLLCIYCFRDVEILYEALQEYISFNKNHDTGRFGYTKASQAFNAFRHRFMVRPVHIHQVKKVVELERCAYFGGRTECWQLGEIDGGEKTFLDVNSMYPWVMREHRYPTKLRSYYEGEECSKALDLLDGSAVVAEVTLDTDEPVYALRREDKLIFPVGTFRTFLCTGGLKRSIERGHLRKIHRIAVYECDYIFKSYVDYFYPLKVKYKAEGNRIYTRVVKSFLNSLYGKFGQKQPVMETYLDPEAGPPKSVMCIDLETGERWLEYQAFGHTHRQIGEENGDKSFVAIAAHVTEYSRIALWDLCVAVGLERVYYMDTDSICVRTADMHRLDGLIHDQRLGALSVDKVCQELVFYGAKHYRYDGKRVCKGVPKSAVEIAEHVYQYDQFLGSRTHHRLGESGSFLVRQTTKAAAPSYDKGQVLDSSRVVPWRLNEPD